MEEGKGDKGDKLVLLFWWSLGARIVGELKLALIWPIVILVFCSTQMGKAS